MNHEQAKLLANLSSAIAIQIPDQGATLHVSGSSLAPTASAIPTATGTTDSFFSGPAFSLVTGTTTTREWHRQLDE